MRKLLAGIGLFVALCAPFIALDKHLQAALIVLGYAGFCLGFYQRKPKAFSADICFAYASQTGNAQAIAEQSVQALQQLGINAQSLSLNQLPSKAFTGTVFFIASTYGEGEAPDNGARFLKSLSKADVGTLKYAVLALGDHSYQAFCAFGLRLDQALAAKGATRLFDTLTCHQQKPAVLDRWFDQLSQFTGHPLARPQAQLSSLTLLKRICLNPTSTADKVYQLVFKIPQGSWQAGDLLDIWPNNDQGLSPRTYSIASVNGQLELIVRQMFSPDSVMGLGSKWLTETLKINAQALGSLRRHTAFHGPAAHTPMILIGAGTGLAGLRAHLQERPQGSQNWLIFGERNRETDYLLKHELEQFQACGKLTKLDLAFSRDGVDKRYVQHVLSEKAAELSAWLAQGAAIYLCGSLNGMGQAVEQTLKELLGEATLSELYASGRYRRDLY